MRVGERDEEGGSSSWVRSCTASPGRYTNTGQACTRSAKCAKTGDATAQFLVRLFTRRCYAATVAWSWTEPETVEAPQLQLVQFLEVIDTPVVLVTTGACVGPDRAENREVSALVLGLGSLPVVVQRQVPDGRDSAEICGVSAVGAGSWSRLLTCPCWPRHGVVEVPQLQFIDWCVSSSWL